MMELRTFLTVLLLGSACSSEPATSPEPLPSDNAIRLALRHQASGILPDMELAAIYDGILKRGEAVTPASRCTLVGIDFFNQVSVTLDEPTAELWRQGERVTGVVALDALIADFRMTISPQREPLIQSFTLEVDLQAVIPGERDESALTGLSVRTDRLAALFAEISVVLESQHELGLDGDSPNIELSEADADTWELLYDYGWGDCPSLCTYHRYWRTHVPKDPSLPAELIESFGDPDGIDDPERAERLRGHVIETCGSI